MTTYTSGDHLVLASILIPTLFLFFTCIFIKDTKKIYKLVVLSFTMSTLLFSLSLLKAGLRYQMYDGVYLTGNYIGNFDFVVDIISFPIALTILFISLFIGIYAFPYMHRKFEYENLDIEREIKIFYVLYFVFSISMFATVLSTNLLEFYLFLELGLISSFILINNYGYGDRRKIALLYLVWTHIGAVMFLIGSLLLGVYNATFDVYLSRTGILGNLSSNLPKELALFAFYFMLIGLLVKAASFGFHFWLPYAHAEAPTPISALLSPLLIGIGPYAIYRFVIPIFPNQFTDFSNYLAIWGVLTIIYGGLNALYEVDFKRFLAYSSISQMGYLILAVSTNSIYGYVGLLLHYIAHAFGKAILFGSAGSVIYHMHELRDIRKMGGLIKTIPYTGNVALVGFFGITGMPPTIGFWSELFIIRGATDAFAAKGTIGVLILALLFLGFSISIAYSFYNYKRIFLGPTKDEDFKNSEDKTLVSSLIVFAAVSIILFAFIPAYADILTKYLSMIHGGT